MNSIRDRNNISAKTKIKEEKYDYKYIKKLNMVVKQAFDKELWVIREKLLVLFFLPHRNETLQRNARKKLYGGWFSLKSSLL